MTHASTPSDAPSGGFVASTIGRRATPVRPAGSPVRACVAQPDWQHRECRRPPRRKARWKPRNAGSGRLLRIVSGRSRPALAVTPLRRDRLRMLACRGRSSRWEFRKRERRLGDGPPSRLRRYGATAFVWLAEPKLMLRHLQALAKAGAEERTRTFTPLRAPAPQTGGLAVLTRTEAYPADGRWAGACCRARLRRIYSHTFAHALERIPPI